MRRKYPTSKEINSILDKILGNTSNKRFIILLFIIILTFISIWIYPLFSQELQLQQNIFNQNRGIGQSLISTNITLNNSNFNNISLTNKLDNRIDIKTAWLKNDLTNSNRVIISVFPVQTYSNEDVISNLRPFLNNGGMISANSSVLIFADREYNVKRLVDIVKQLNHLAIENQEIRVLQRSNIDSAAFSENINKLFDDKIISSAISRGNFLIIKGKKEYLDEIDILISKIPPSDAVFETRIIKLKNTNLLDIFDGLSNMYRDSALVATDYRTYSLIVNAERKIMAEIVNLIETAEKNKGKTAETSIIQLKNLDVLKIETLLDIMFGNRP